MPGVRPVRIIALIWLAWAVLLIGFQNLVAARFEPRRPDYVLPWTPSETGHTSRDDKPYLIEPFMNAQVSWDSEFYLSIATRGYDDPYVRGVFIPGVGSVSMNYAFFPFYPLVMGIVAVPLRVLGLNPVAAATLAGVLISLLGALAAMLALYDITRDELGRSGGLRAAFYLLIFPSGFFLAQVYTEGLFVGLAFVSLALLRRRHVAWALPAAAALAMLATWTRAVGLALVFPLALAWAREVDWAGLPARLPSWRTLARGLLVLAPILAHLIWRASLGAKFDLVEAYWFGRGLLVVERTLKNWQQIVAVLSAGEYPQTLAYYSIEVFGVALALIACVAVARRYPGVALFGLAATVVALTSGWPQSLIRYVLVAPAIYIFLARLGRHPAFDRAWTLASTLLMGLLATLFTFDMWVA